MIPSKTFGTATADRAFINELLKQLSATQGKSTLTLDVKSKPLYRYRNIEGASESAKKFIENCNISLD